MINLKSQRRKYKTDNKIHKTDVLLLVRHLVIAGLRSLNANAYQNQEQQEHLGLIEDHEEIKKKNKNEQI